MGGAGRRRLPFWLLFAALLLVAIEAVSYAAIAATRRVLDEPIRRTADIYAEQSRQITRFLDTAAGRREMPDAELGWRYRPAFTSPADHVSPQGLRGTREYARTPRPGVVRVAAFGDSFVYGNEVADSVAWSTVLEQADRTVEILNYGVGGYGTDQAYLRYLREGKQFEPDVVVIGFTPVDLGRIVNVYRRFISASEGPYIKPRFVRSDSGTLRLVSAHVPTWDDYRRYLRSPQAVRELGRLDYWYEPAIYENPAYDWSATVRLAVATWIRLKRRYTGPNRLLTGGTFNVRSEAFGLQVAVLEAFADSVRGDGRQPLVVLLPDRESVARAYDGNLPTYDPLKRSLDNAGVPVLDLGPAFRRVIVAGDLDPWFMPGGHYSPAGNAVVAAAIASWLGESRSAPDARTHPPSPAAIVVGPRVGRSFP